MDAFTIYAPPELPNGCFPSAMFRETNEGESVIQEAHL